MSIPCGKRPQMDENIAILENKTLLYGWGVIFYKNNNIILSFP